MRMILDGMGGDHAPASVVEGAILAMKEMEHEIVIVGQQELIEAELKKHKYDHQRLSVVDARDVITNDDAPVRAVRTKKDSSIVRGISMVKDGEGDIFISAGSTGALLCGGLFILGRIRGVDRPALASIYPIVGGQASLLVDAGANTECKPANLLEFAVMGSIYMEKVIGRRCPRIGLVNVGEESKKGSALTKVTYEMLTESDLNFVGNVEARDVPFGAADVIVADGFSGNILLKTMEGTAMFMSDMMKQMFYRNPLTMLGALLCKKGINGIRKTMDYRETGGSIVIGISRPVIKAHGSSDDAAIRGAIRQAIRAVESGFCEEIRANIGQMILPREEEHAE